MNKYWAIWDKDEKRFINSTIIEVNFRNKKNIIIYRTDVDETIPAKVILFEKRVCIRICGFMNEEEEFDRYEPRKVSITVEEK